jgi:hypothetical protein
VRNISLINGGNMRLVFLLILFYSFNGSAKIVIEDNKFFILNKKSKNPILMINDLIEKKMVSKVKIFLGGETHLLSFSEGKQKEKLYSVASDGYIYSLEPFTNFDVKKVTADGGILFRQLPDKIYRVNENGIFFY